MTRAKGDGTETIEIHNSPISYQDEDGTWKARDDSLTGTADGGYRRTAGPHEIRFGGVADHSTLTASGSGWSVGFSLIGATAGRTAQLETSRGVRYGNVVDGVDLEYRVAGDRVKEELILARPPARDADGLEAGNSRFILSLVDIRPVTETDGTIAFLDRTGAIVAHIPAGHAYDSAGLRGADGSRLPGHHTGRTSVKTTLVRLPDGGWAVDTSVDRAWLLNPRRIYPVVIDPTLVLGREGNPVTDAYDYYEIREFAGSTTVTYDNSDFNFTYAGKGTYFDETAGCPHALDYGAITHATFGLSDLPGKQINSARFYANLLGGTGTLTVGAADSAAHNSMRTEGATTLAVAPGLVDVDAKAWVQKWTDTTWANHGVMLTSTEILAFATAESGSGPYIEVNYVSDDGVRSLAATSKSGEVSATWQAPVTPGYTGYTMKLYRKAGPQLVQTKTCVGCLSVRFTHVVNRHLYYVEVTPTGSTDPQQSNAVEPDQTVASGSLTTAQTRGGGNPASDNCVCTQEEVVQPINTATGVFYHTFEDFLIPGRGVPLSMSHTYSSDEASRQSDGPLGHGWTFTYNLSLVISSDPPQVTVRQENGAEAAFVPGPGSAYVPVASWLDATLVHNPDGTYTFTRKGTEVMVFSATGQLSQLRDLNNYVTTVTRTSTTMVVTEPAGRTLTFAYSGGHIQTVTDNSISPARVLTFRYLDGQNNLNEVVDVNNGVTKFTYKTGTHQLETMLFPKYASDPSKAVTNAYDAAGRVYEQTDQLGRTTSFDYQPTGELYDEGQVWSVVVSDPTQRKVLHRYEHGVLVSKVVGYQPPGTETRPAVTWSYGYDPENLGATTVTDPNGHTTRSEFNDPHGNRTATTDARDKTTTWTYNTFGQVRTVTDAINVTTTSAYDGAWGTDAGNLRTVSTPLVGSSPPATRTTTFNYLEDGHTFAGDVTSVLDPNGERTTFGYDPKGNRNRVTDPLNHTTTAIFDGGGRKTSEVSARGNAPGATPADFTTTYTYEPDNLVRTVTDPLGHVSERHYDANRKLEWSKDAELRKTAFEYDAADQLTKTIRGHATPEAVTERTEYWNDGQVRYQYDAANQATTYGYDDLGRLSTVTDPLSRMVTYGYDLAGNQLTKAEHGGTCTVPKSWCTTSSYDPVNRLTSIDYSDTNTPDVTSIVYDDANRRTGMTDGTGTSSWAWDSLGRLKTSTNGAGQQVTYDYQLGGELKQITYPGNKVVTRHFDDAGNLDWVEDWLGNRSLFGYDEDNNWTTKTLPTASGVSEARDYDRADRLMEIAVTKGANTLASFDYGRTNADLVSSVTSTGVPSDNRSYAYDANARLCWAGPTSGACASPPSGATQYGYDGADNLSRLGTPNQGFDAAHQLCWSGTGTGTCPSPPSGATTYAYDTRGNRTTRTTPGGEITYSYDQANRLTDVSSTPAAPTGFLRVTTNPPLASQITVDGEIRNTWGLNWLHIAPGGHTVCFKDIEGWTTPPCQTTTVTEGQTATVEGTFTQRGFLVVGTSPSGLSDAVISVDGVARDNGAVYTDVHSGAHTVCWGPVSNYTPPACQSVSVTAGTTTTLTGSYTATAGAPGPNPSDGFLRVTTAPAVPSQVSVDGQWRDTWGLDWLRMAPGSHAVCFRDNIEGYTAPACQTVSVATGVTTTVAGQFTQRGFLVAETAAVPGGITPTIFVDGIARNDSGVYTDLSAGPHRVCFSPVGIGPPPPCRDVQVVAGTTTTTVGTYSGAVSYDYNGDGLRVSKTTSSGTKVFTWDESQGLPLLLSEGPVASATRYIYGPGGSLLSKITASDDVTYYHQDQLGSTRLLTSEAGAVTATYTFDPYGQLSASTGAAGAQPFGYAGEYTDAETGFQYLRARYYDPATGQFLTRDPIEAVTREAYGYVGGDPLNGTDPSGHNKCEVGLNPLRWGGNAVDCTVKAGREVHEAAKGEQAQLAKDVLNQVATITSGLGAVSATLALIPSPASPFLLGAAGVFQASAGLTGGLAGTIDCLDGGGAFGCASSIAGAATNLVAPGVLRAAAAKYGPRTAKALYAGLSNLGFAANAASTASGLRARVFC